MYDLWFATGIAVMRPALVNSVAAAKPAGAVFFELRKREITETNAGVVTRLPLSPATGVLDNLTTTRVRQAIADFVKGVAPAPPPISILTAGRFCQYLQLNTFNSTDPQGNFRKIVGLANTAYMNAIAASPETQMPGFPAFLGACLMDGTLANDLANATEDQKNAAREFGLNPDPADTDWGIAVRFTAHPSFLQASALLMNGDSDPWDNGSGELMFFWAGKSERAIL